MPRLRNDQAVFGDNRSWLDHVNTLLNIQLNGERCTICALYTLRRQNIQSEIVKIHELKRDPPKLINIIRTLHNGEWLNKGSEDFSIGMRSVSTSIQYRSRYHS